jgi:outer membrane protein assembly factor BamD
VLNFKNVLKNMKKVYQIALFMAVLAGTMHSCVPEIEKIKKNPDFKYKFEKALAYYEKENYTDAQTLFEDVMPFYRGSDKAEEIAWHYANCSFFLKEYTTSAYYFKQFSNTFPNSKYTEDATFMIATAFDKQAPNQMLDQDNTHKAIEAYQLFINTFPNSKRAEECNKNIDKLRDRLYRKDFESAQLYFQVEDYRAAVHALKNLLKNYPDGNDAENARFMIVKSNFFLAQNSIETKQLDRYQETLAAYTELVDKHPGGKKTKEAERYFESATQKIIQLKAQ